MSTTNRHHSTINNGINNKKIITEREKNEIGKLLNEKFTCSICLDILEEPSGLKCGHMFCSKCLIPWLRDHRTCPMCRSVIPLQTKINKYEFLAKLIADMKAVLESNVERRHTVNIANYVVRPVYNLGRRNNRQNNNERPPWRF